MDRRGDKQIGGAEKAWPNRPGELRMVESGVSDEAHHFVFVSTGQDEASVDVLEAGHRECGVR